MAALRAGADDYLARPCDLDELLLRLDRLLANRTAALQVLQGDLANHPLWALLQYLGQVRKTGILRVKGESGAGTIEMREGEPAEARWQGQLRGREALLALLSLEEGGFRFDPLAARRGAAGRPPGLPLQELLMDSAWLKDEIGKRRHHLPPTGQPLQALTPNLPAIERLRFPPSAAGLRARAPAAGGAVVRSDRRRDRGADLDPARHRPAGRARRSSLRSPPRPSAELQNTREISTAHPLRGGDRGSARGGGRERGSPPRPSPTCCSWSRRSGRPCAGCSSSRPASARTRGCAGWSSRSSCARRAAPPSRAAAASSRCTSRCSRARSQPQVNAIVPGCAGILVWIRGTEALDGVRAVVQRLEASGPRGAAGVLVAGAEAASREAGALLRGASRWRSTPHEPQSLLGLLRLLHPDAR